MLLKLAFSLVLAPMCWPAQPAAVQLESGRVVARNSSGMALWSVQPRDAGKISVHATANGGFDLGDGTVLSAQGRAVAHSAWGLPVTIDPTANFDLPPAPQFDPMGNAWVVTLSADEAPLTAIESNGTSGTWQAPQSITPPSMEPAGIPAMAIDSAGVVHVVCRNLSSQQYQIIYTSHAPGGVWQTPQVIYSSPYFFQNIDLTIDSAGDLIVVFDRASASSGLPQGWSLVYAAASGVWGNATLISSAGQAFYLPSLARNPSGSLVMLVYTGELGAGLFYQVFSVANQSWSTPAPISGTNAAADSAYGIGAKYPLAINSSGIAALVAPYYTLPSGTDYKLEGLVYQGGSWTNSKTLIPWSPATQDGDVLDFGSIAENSLGEVLAAGAGYTSTAQDINAYRFVPGTGWDVERVAQQSPDLSLSDIGVAWFEFDGEAVVSYFDTTTLKATVYSKGAWSYSPAVPGTTAFGCDPLASAPAGQVLLLTLSPSLEIQADFLRP